MPIDFSTMLPYDIDYIDLMKHFETFPIFDNRNLQKNHLNKWKTVLKSADSKIRKIFKNPKKLKDILDIVMTEESFQQVTHFGKNTVILNFTIAPLVKLAEQNKQNAIEIPLTYFEKSREFVTWTPISQTDNRSLKVLPILLTHFYNARTFGFLLIDGNHRVSQAIKNHDKTIEALIFDPRYMLNDNIFRSEFDKLFFIFQNELYYLSHCKKQHQMKDKELLSRSYLANFEFNFLDVMPDLKIWI